MEELLKMTGEERSQIFQEASARSNIIKSSTIFEKDFWVCWILEKIFTIPDIRSYITFKGGTSLSKCFNIISRFSEDCDLTLDKEFLEIKEDTETILKMRSKQQIKFLNNLIKKSKDKINNTIKPLLIAKCREELSLYYNSNEWKIEADPEENQSLLFYYPSNITDTKDEYIQSTIKLEFGARGDTTPNEEKSISPYLHSALPELFDHTPEINVKTLTAERTFWEKATLLHAEHHRKYDNPPKQARIFRHYYDMMMLERANITESALKDASLLEKVVKNKTVFFRSAWANYETAKIGSLCLSPADFFKNVLKQDCKKMAEMFFGEAPDFSKVMDNIKKIQEKINDFAQ